MKDMFFLLIVVGLGLGIDVIVFYYFFIGVKFFVIIKVFCKMFVLKYLFLLEKKLKEMG